MSVSNRIIELRKDKGLSQFQLSKLLGVSRQAVSKWENGLSIPDMENLMSISDVLGVSLEYLTTGKENTPSPAPPVERIVEVEKVVETVVEKVVEIEKPVYIDREKVVEVPKTVLKRVYRTKYVRNPVEFVLFGLILFGLGLLLGVLL